MTALKQELPVGFLCLQAYTSWLIILFLGRKAEQLHIFLNAVLHGCGGKGWERPCEGQKSPLQAGTAHRGWKQLLLAPCEAWGQLGTLIFFCGSPFSLLVGMCVSPGEEQGLAADGRCGACTTDTTRFTRPRRGQIVTKNSLVSTQDSIQPSVWACK